MTFILRLGFCVPSSIPFISPAGASSMLLIFKELILAFPLCYFTKFYFPFISQFLLAPSDCFPWCFSAVSAPPPLGFCLNAALAAPCTWNVLL